jgi:hypothetical protein
VVPSLDFCLYKIDNKWLKDRQIAPVRIMKPDWRFLNCATIGFSCPQLFDATTWRQKYG